MIDSVDLKDSMIQAMKEFYKSYIVESVNGSFQIFQSFTYGEMVISFLLFSILLLFILKWVYEVVR